MMSQGTRIFPLGELQEMSPEEALNYVFDSLNQKGYNPVNQIVGYLISGDPLYISSHNNARSVIQRVERDEIVELLLATYIKTK